MWKAALVVGGLVLFAVTGCTSGSGRGGDSVAGAIPTRPVAKPKARTVTTPAPAVRNVSPPTSRPSAGADHVQQPAVAPRKGAAPKRADVRAKPDGLASYYANRYHGRLTANGERFDVRKMTAAHRTLAFGTRVRVTNASNGRSVVVRVNDRGPFVAGRVIDLSPAAARQLDMLRAGLVPVRLEVLGSGTSQRGAVAAGS